MANNEVMIWWRYYWGRCWRGWKIKLRREKRRRSVVKPIVCSSVPWWARVWILFTQNCGSSGFISSPLKKRPAVEGCVCGSAVLMRHSLSAKKPWHINYAKVLFVLSRPKLVCDGCESTNRKSSWRCEQAGGPHSSTRLTLLLFPVLLFELKAAWSWNKCFVCLFVCVVIILFRAHYWCLFCVKFGAHTLFFSHYSPVLPGVFADDDRNTFVKLH